MSAPHIQTPGVLRVLMPMINEAIYALMEGVGTAESIDTGMRLGMNHPMGPLLRRHVAAGWLGRKSGRGFYRYGGYGSPGGTPWTSR